MKRFLQAVVFTILLLNAEDVFSQIDTSYRWTWIGGDGFANTNGVYGQKGVEKPTNKPGARVAASNWIDKNGNLWLFGGYGYTSSGVGYLNDLWKYNLTSNQWTWVAGDSVANALAFHGDIGKEGIGYTPSARFAAAYWSNGTGTDLYLYGGFSNGSITGDVWSFNVNSNEWTFVKAEIVDSVGNCTGHAFGDIGEFTAGVWPLCRYYATAASAGSIAYLFGGSTGFQLLGDLYHFANSDNTPSNEWGYLKFSNPDVIDKPSTHVYGGGELRSRSNPMGFVGPNATLYIFGGTGYDDNFENKGNFNDTWIYNGIDLITKEPRWIWVNGDSSINSKGNYGTFGVADRGNNPPARNAGTIRSAGNGQFILFGGGGDSSSLFNDVWNYDTQYNTWTWIGGTKTLNSFGIYGQKGVQLSSNMIRACGEQASWITANGDMYVFGGRTQFGWSNDLWKFSKPQDLITIDAINANKFYPGSQIRISYSIHPQASNPFDTSNIFYLQLSDGNGDFTKSVFTGTTHSNTSGTIVTTIPYNIGIGSNCKIRIYSTKPSYTSPAYSQPITINPNPIVAASAQIVFANKEFTMSDGWTNYYNDTLLVLSLHKNGNNMGSIGDGTFAVECTATQAAGSGTGVHVTNPLVTNTSGYWTMNRFWTVKPTYEPSAPVGVRFYFNDADIEDVKASVPTLKSVTDLQFYKTIGGNPDPISNWAGATSVIPILNGSVPSDTSWTYQLYGIGMHRAEFTVGSFSGGGGGGTQDGQVLPIQLTDFTGSLQDATAVLKWQTTTEVNTSYYTVQRSVDRVNFIALDKVTATHNTSSGKDYTYYDEAINNLNSKSVFYRLQITDKDGKISYSQVVVVKVLHQHLFTLLPNPAKGKIIISGEKLSSVKIYDVNGKLLIIRSNIELDNVMISVNNLSKGVYIVQVEDKNRNKETKKMIVE